MKVSIYGDLFPSGVTTDWFSKSSTDELFKDVKRVLKSSDINIVNLECVLTDSKFRVDKDGPHHVSPMKCLNAIEDAGFDALSLSNNHILDAGEVGLSELLEELEKRKISFTGAGRFYEEIHKPLILQHETGKPILIISISDLEFNVSVNGVGAKIYDPLKIFDEITDVSKDCNVIILYHSGLENYQYPSPDLQRKCRKMIDKGAKAVICQHSHCIGSFEEYNEGLVVYGQGNFFMPYSTNRDSWNQSVIVTLDFTLDKMDYSFVAVQTEVNCVRLMEPDESARMIKEFFGRSTLIIDEYFVLNEWSKAVRRVFWKYEALMLGGKKIHYYFAYIINEVLRLNGKKKATSILNLHRSDTHNEVMKTRLSQLLQGEE